MSYRVLARTYRSNTFDEVVGQETIATTLKNAIKSGRVHHGYLFTGTRGVGKTSMARILAKALNCLAGDAPTITPCCACHSCQAIAIGEDIDVVEIDAASNTGVDNIRELRSNATLRPARSRFKVYIIDEVHMLSTGAFNALLKTLEEPPSHVKFILATTEAQKVPATIQSRCQRFDFRAIGTAAIADHLRRVVEAEGLTAEEGVLRRIARLANGSMRDGLSLLDKLLSYEPTELTAEVANDIIPPPHDELAAAVIDCIARRDAPGALGALDRALQSGRTVERFCDHLIDHVRTLMVLRVCGEGTELVDVSGSMRPVLVEQAARFDASTYVFMVTLLEELRRNVKFSGAARALADAAVVRLAMAEQFTDIADLIARLDGDDGAPSPGATSRGSKKKAAGDGKVADSRSTYAEPRASARADAATATAATHPPISNTAVQSVTDDAESTGESGGHLAEPRRTCLPAASAAVKRRAAPSDRSPARSEARFITPVGSEQGAVIPVGLAPAAPTLSSKDWERVARDELVVRVKEAVDGTLLDVRANRPAALPASADAQPDDEQGMDTLAAAAE